MGRTGDSKQSFVACRDNHCKAPLSHSLRIKPTGLICGPTEYTHTHTLTHTHAHTSKHLHNTWTALLLSIFTLHHTCFPFFLSPAQTNTPLAPSHTLAPPRSSLCHIFALRLHAHFKMDTCQHAALYMMFIFTHSNVHSVDRHMYCRRY